MWHFVVCDDDTAQRQAVIKGLQTALHTLHIEPDRFDIVAYDSLQALQRHPAPPTVLLLDVAFDNPDDGIRVSTQLRGRWPDMQLIFVTSMQEYITSCFDAYAIGYVTKKCMDTQLLPAVERAVRRLRHCPPPPPVIPFRIGWEPIEVPLPDILYVAMVERHLHLHLTPAEKYWKNPLVYRGTIKEEAARLGKYGLYRVNKSLIVNLGNVQDVQPEAVILRDGQKIPIGIKSYRPLYFQWMNIREKERWNTFSH